MTVLARAFEEQVIRTIPGVLRLEAQSTFSVTRPPGMPSTTNREMMIRVIAVGQTPEGAQLAANDAASMICRTTLTNYGVTGMVIDRADRARSYSYFHDSFQPAIARLFSR